MTIRIASITSQFAIFEALDMFLRRLLFPLAAICIAIITFIPSCKHSNRGCGETKVSEAGGDESHHNGANCMTCHSTKGDGEGCFTVGGSVYDNTLTNPVNSGKIRLYSEPSGAGTVVAELPIDGRGNFYTTRQVNFGTGLYPAYVSPSGTERYMSSLITTGQCASCHGVTQSNIFAP